MEITKDHSFAELSCLIKNVSKPPSNGTNISKTGIIFISND